MAGGLGAIADWFPIKVRALAQLLYPGDCDASLRASDKPGTMW